MAESNKNEIENSEVQKVDEELDSLLDSALDEFTETIKEKPTPKKDEASSKVDDPESMSDYDPEMINQYFNADFDIQDLLRSVDTGDSEYDNLIRMAFTQAATKALEADTYTSSPGALQPEELAKLFQDLDLNTEIPNERTDDNMPPFMPPFKPPFMTSILRFFLCKDVLYPPMMHFLEKYPGWLDEHKATLAPDLYENYSKQLELMKKIVEEFDSESTTDSEDIKMDRITRIMSYMQQVKLLGEPPMDLYYRGDLPMGLEGADPSCSIM